jgi:hypothetical protein
MVIQLEASIRHVDRQILTVKSQLAHEERPALKTQLYKLHDLRVKTQAALNLLAEASRRPAA